tara:strand:+ start:1007 stop:1255 length:249 start_codon:yes stop_codon:yes gene_type:complete
METDITTRYNKVANALAKLTGMTEGRAKAAITFQEYDKALTYYKELIHIHKDHPLHSSKDWVKEWEEKCKEIMQLKGEGISL